jgi:hypothetical protein
MDYFSFFKCKGYYYGKRASFLKTALLKKSRPLGFISSNISVSAENLIETTQKLHTAFATDTRRVSDKTMDASIMLSNTRLDGKLKVSSVIAVLFKIHRN